MTILYFTTSACCALTLTCDIFILSHPHLSIKKFPIFFLSFSVPFFLVLYLDFAPLLWITLMLNSLLLVWFSKKLYMIIYTPLSYMVNCILSNLHALVVSNLSGLSIIDIDLTYSTDIFLLILAYMCTIIASCPVLYLSRRLIQKYLVPILTKTNKKLVLLIGFVASLCAFLLCAFLLFVMASLFDNLSSPSSDFPILLLVLFLYFLFTMGMIFIVLYTTKINYETQKKVEYLENLNEYTRNLEMLYNNLRAFKHDYVNIMTSLTAYIDEKRYDEMETFFYEHILPMQKNLIHKNSTLNNLLHINVLELKSILYTKLLLAVNQDIDVNIDIPDEIDSLDMDPVDLTRMLGIYLDNAIEACLETEHPTINFHLGKMSDDIVIIISNTYIDKGLSVTQMYKKEVTTKRDGHGIGLHNVSEILNRYNNIYHETRMEDGMFIQQVQIT